MARLIDADAVDYENIMCSQSQLHWLNAIIEKQPTVDAVPVVHGRWVVGLDGGYMCSECHEVHRYDIGYYCTFCGAKLEGVGIG